MRFMKNSPALALLLSQPQKPDRIYGRGSSHRRRRTADPNTVADRSSFLDVIHSGVTVLLPLGVIDIDCIGRTRPIDYITTDN